MIELKVGCSQHKYPSRKVRLNAGETSGAIQTGGSVDGTAGSGLHSQGGASGTVRVSDHRAGGHVFPQRYGVGGMSRS